MGRIIELNLYVTAAHAVHTTVCTVCTDCIPQRNNLTMDPSTKTLNRDMKLSRTIESVKPYFPTRFLLFPCPLIMQSGGKRDAPEEGRAH